NQLKGDRPLLDHAIFGGYWFVNGTGTSNTLLESRHIPVSAVAGSPFLAGKQQVFASQTFTPDVVLYRGDTIFQPPDYQFRFTPTFNYSSTHTSGAATSTTATTFGAQALFV